MTQASSKRGRPAHPDILTPAERQVLARVRQGLTNAEIAADLGITFHTVKFHISNMLGKLHLKDRRELAAWDEKKYRAEQGKERRFALLSLGSLKLAGVVSGGVVAVAGLALTAGIVANLNSGADAGPASPEGIVVAPEHPITVFEEAGSKDMKVTEFESTREGLAHASAVAGFEVKAVELPDGYVLENVAIPAKPPFNAPGAPQRVTLKATNGEQSLIIMQVNHHFDFLGKDADHLLPLSSLGDLYKVPSATVTQYTLLTEDRSYDIAVPTTSGLDDAAVVQILESMAK